MREERPVLVMKMGTEMPPTHAATRWQRPADEAVLAKLVQLFASIRSEVLAATGKAGVSGGIPADFSLRRKEREGIDALLYYAFDITEDGRVEPSDYLPHNELADALHKLLKQEIEGSNA